MYLMPYDQPVGRYSIWLHQCSQLISYEGKRYETSELGLKSRANIPRLVKRIANFCFVYLDWINIFGGPALHNRLQNIYIYTQAFSRHWKCLHIKVQVCTPQHTLPHKAHGHNMEVYYTLKIIIKLLTSGALATPCLNLDNSVDEIVANKKRKD